jgi:hypothetical protein
VDEVVGGVAIAVTWIFTVGYIAAYFFMICKFYFDNSVFLFNPQMSGAVQIIFCFSNLGQTYFYIRDILAALSIFW